MLNAHNKILKYNQDQKSMKIPFTFQVDKKSTWEITHVW